MKKLSQAGELDDGKINEIMSEEKANQKERIKIPLDRVQKYFPKSFSNSQIEDAIVKMCEAQYRKRQGPER
jgi:ParB family chromosome partitioning protein